MLDPKTIPSCLLIISSMGILSGVIALVQGIISNYGWVGIILGVVGAIYWSTELIKIRNKELLNDRRTD